MVELLQATFAQKPSQRKAFLEQACGGDETLRQEVSALLVTEAESPAGERADSIQAPSLGDGRSARLSEGTVLGRYRIVGLLGEGGMGQAYRATDLQLGRDVAIKVVLPGAHELVPRFAREAQTVAAISHPNIPAIHDFGMHWICSAWISLRARGPTRQGVRNSPSTPAD